MWGSYQRCRGLLCHNYYAGGSSLCYQYLRGRVLLHGSSLFHPPIACKEYAVPRDRSPAKEGRDHLSFLAICGVALKACPPEACGVLMSPSTSSQGTYPWPTSWPFPPGTFNQRGIFSQKFPPNHPSGNCILPRDQTTLSTQPGNILTMIRRSKDI